MIPNTHSSLSPSFVPFHQVPSFPATSTPITVNPDQFGTISQRELDLLNDLPGSAIRVYIALANHANPNGYCWPGRARLAAMTQLHPDAVSRALKQLEDAGLIKRLGNSRYLLPLHPLTKPSAPKPAGWQNCQTEQTTLNRPTERAATAPATSKPEAVPPEAPVPSLSCPQVKIETRSTLPEDWTLPDDWLDLARQERPDLDVAEIQVSAANFRDYHLSRGTQSNGWRHEWRRWIRRERPPKHSRPSTSRSEPSRPYNAWNPAPAPVITPEERAERDRAHQERLAEADKQAEQRRRQMLMDRGISPDTGERITPATPATPTAGRSRSPLSGVLDTLRGQVQRE